MSPSIMPASGISPVSGVSVVVVTASRESRERERAQKADTRIGAQPIREAEPRNPCDRLTDAATRESSFAALVDGLVAVLVHVRRKALRFRGNGPGSMSSQSPPAHSIENGSVHVHVAHDVAVGEATPHRFVCTDRADKASSSGGTQPFSSASKRETDHSARWPLQKTPSSHSASADALHRTVDETRLGITRVEDARRRDRFVVVSSAREARGSSTQRESHASGLLVHRVVHHDGELVDQRDGPTRAPSAPMSSR